MSVAWLATTQVEEADELLPRSCQGRTGYP